MAKVTRPSADKTRKKILQAAKVLFLQKGFDGTYIKHIAERAKVHTNLIFHHFTDKAALWHQVKAHILAKDIQAPQYDMSSAKAYFKSIIAHRFVIYSKHPDIARLIQWQQLTDKESALIDIGKHSPNQWLQPFRDFQEKSEIHTNVEAEQILLFIVFSSYAPFLQQVIPLHPTQIARYENMLFTMCCQQFLTVEEG